MHAKIITFAAGALFALSSAVPMNNEKRDLVWVTEIETAIETVAVTTTVWVDPTPTADVQKQEKPAHYGHGHKHQKQEQDAQSTTEAQPTPSPEPSTQAPAPTSEPAPAPSSYESSPAPSSQEAYSAPPAPSSSAVVEQPSSVAAPAAPATTEAPAAPVSSYVAPAPSSSSAPAPASYDSGSSSGSSSNPASGESFTGEMTYFTPGMGACGITSGEGDKMVAISQSLFDQYTPNGNPNKNPLCGQTVTIKGADGADHEATILDRCVGCAESDLDMPQSFFNTVTTPKGKTEPADGRAYGMSWSIN